MEKKEYIERGAILRKSETMFDGQKYCTAVNTGFIYTAPAADVVEVVHGEWKKMDTTGIDAKENVWNCSACGYPVGVWTAGSKYCPNCGAKMDGGNRDADA